MAKRSFSGQLAFDLPTRTALGREDFMVTEANQSALDRVERWPDWGYPVLAIVGPPASGKSHLARVWQTMAEARQVHLGDLTVQRVGEFMEAPALLIEDAPVESMDETALFHAFNLARERAHTILITTTKDPAQWQVGLPDLASRLKAVGVARLNPPDDALLRAVLVKQFNDRQLAVDEATIGYMLARMERSFNAARALVAEIDRRALADAAAVTRSFVARVMADAPFAGIEET